MSMRITVEAKSHLRGTISVPENTCLPFHTAARMMAAATLAQHSDLILEHVNIHPDHTGFLRYAILMGARITLLDQRWMGDQPVSSIHVQHANQLRAIEVRSEHISTLENELPFLNIMASVAKGTSRFPAQGSLSLAVLEALGVQATRLSDTLVIEGFGARALHGGTFTAVDASTEDALWVASVAALKPIVLEKEASCA